MVSVSELIQPPLKLQQLTSFTMKGAKGEQGRDIAKILSILRITLQIQGKSD